MRIIKTIAICFLMITLGSCGVGTDVEKYAADCWKVIGSDDIEIENIYVMHYTSRLELTGEVLDTDMYLELPENGYVILFDAYCFPAFYDSYACFLNQKGQLVYTFDYEENHKLFEMYYADFSVYNVKDGEIALEYITNCNYIAGMINDADGKEYDGKMQKNTWYSLTEKQIEKVLR